MNILTQFFEQNKEIIFFLYGLSFFILGLVILLQTRRSSRLDLARSLVWLAIFGLTHGLTEWGYLFIPIQEGHISPVIVQLLYVTQLILLAVSFACLFEFGVSLFRPLGKALWLHGVAAGLFGAWLFITFFFVLPLAPHLSEWREISNALARYMIGFPGGLIAAYGLRENTLKRIAPLNFPIIVGTLRMTGMVLGLYAILAGLISPPIPFFPGNIINTNVFLHIVGIPAYVFRALMGLLMALLIIQALEIFELETEIGRAHV